MDTEGECVMLKQIMKYHIETGGTKKLTSLLENRPLIRQRILSETSFLPPNSPPAARFFCFINNISQLPSCKICGRPTKWGRLFSSGFNTYCSVSCKNKDPIQQQLCKDGVIATFGVSNISKVPSIIQKKRDNSVLLYGVSNPNQLDSIKSKAINTNLQRYGVIHPMLLPKFQQKVRRTNVERYGVDYIQQEENFKQKTKATNLQKFSREHPTQTHITEDALNKLNDPEWLFHQHVELKQPLTQIAERVGVNDTTVGRYLTKFGIETKHFHESVGQNQISQFLISNGLKVETNVRNIIAPLELDIYLPEYKIAIEYCGLYWHSEQLGKNSTYHYNKYKLCLDKNIRLFTIYEDEWFTKQTTIQDMLLHNLNRSTKSRVFARKLSIKMVGVNEKKRFFEQYHLQGDGPGSINIGLFEDNSLVACISVIQNKGGVLLINRYATSKIVVGGFSRLLSALKKQYEWNVIETFADLRYSQGQLYLSVGFKNVKQLKPDYYYIKNNIRYHKFNFRRKYLPLRLDNFDSSLSEKQNCDANGILRLWDCGKIKFQIFKNW
jgi:hypothetical protein